MLKSFFLTNKIIARFIIDLIHETPTSISGGSLYLLRWG